MNSFEITADQHMDMIEYAGNMVDRHDQVDSSAPTLTEVNTIFIIIFIFAIGKMIIFT